MQSLVVHWLGHGSNKPKKEVRFLPGEFFCIFSSPIMIKEMQVVVKY